MIEADLFQHLRAWLLKATALTDVINAFPAAQAPAGAYGVLNLMDGGPVGVWASQMNYEESPVAGPDGIHDLFQVPAVQWEWTYSVNIFATNAFDEARKISSWCISDAADLLLYPLVAKPVERIRRLPEFVDGSWEGRAQFELVVQGYIQNGSFVNEDGATVVIGRVPVDEILQGTITLSPADNPDLVLSDTYERPTTED